MHEEEVEKGKDLNEDVPSTEIHQDESG